MDSIYEAIGGAAALDAAVRRFYERVTADPLLAPFFRGVDLEHLRKAQAAFLGQALEGPVNYSGSGAHKAHTRLRIEQRHFDAAIDHIVGTLREFRVPDATIRQIIMRITPLDSHIVNTPTPVGAAAD